MTLNILEVRLGSLLRRLVVNNSAMIFPFALVVLTFVSVYVIYLIGAYESNLRLYKELEKQTEVQIHQLYKQK